MSCCTICTETETEKLATNVTLLNSSHKRPEPQSDVKHLVQNQNHCETNLNGEMKGSWAFTPKTCHKCDLAYL